MGYAAALVAVVLVQCCSAFLPSTALPACALTGKAVSSDVIGRGRGCSEGISMAASQQTKKSGRGLRFEIGKDTISYDAFYGPQTPSVVYLPAFDSPSNDLKGAVIERFCSTTGRSYISADWFGVGRSSGDFSQGTVTRWTQDTIRLIEQVAPAGKCVLVGGGVGGWVSILVALQRPELICGLVGLAADPDFTESLLWKYLPEEKKAEIMEKGTADVTWGKTDYPISRVLIEDGRKNLVLEGPAGGLKIHCPVRLVHGLRDEEVPYQVAIDLARRLASRDVVVTLPKSASHNLDDQEDFALIRTAVKDAVDAFYEYDLTSPGSG